MWFGKYEDDELASKQEEDTFSMTSHWVHPDEDSVPKRSKNISADDDDDFSMTANYFHD